MKAKYYLLILMIGLAFSGCETVPMSKTEKGNHLKARITYYTRHEDKWGSKVACSKKLRAKQGVTVAAHPKFPFWTKIFIPALKGIIGNGHFIVQDRGRAVTRKKASKGKLDVFDVFVDGSNRKMNRLAAIMPPEMDVFIEGPLMTQWGNIQ